jgi:RhoGEF domain
MALLSRLHCCGMVLLVGDVATSSSSLLAPRSLLLLCGDASLFFLLCSCVEPEEEQTVVTEMDEQRMKVAKEILQTEETYVCNLRVLRDNFKAPLLRDHEALGLSTAKVASIFGNCELLLEYNTSLLMRLKQADDINTKSFPKEERSVGEIFVHMVRVSGWRDWYCSVKRIRRPMVAESVAMGHSACFCRDDVCCPSVYTVCDRVSPLL